MTGSFNPIDVGEWSEHAYIGDIAKLFKAIVSFDRATVLQIVKDGTTDINRRDHVGRTPLHIAIIVKAIDIAVDLIDNGARITARIVDGRTALHLAAGLDLPIIVRKLLERSAVNAEKVKKEVKAAGVKGRVQKQDDDETDQDDDDDEADVRDSTEDDWNTESAAPKRTVKKEGPVLEGNSDNAIIPEDEEETPDVFDVNLPDWDLAWPALFHAIAVGAIAVIDELLIAGADAKLVFRFTSGYPKVSVHALTLSLLTNDDDRTVQVIERLVKAGAVSTAADENLLSIFQRFVISGRAPLVSTILRIDTNAKAALNFPSTLSNVAVFPLVSALDTGSYAITTTLLAHGAKTNYNEEDLSRARDARSVYAHKFSSI